MMNTYLKYGLCLIAGLVIGYFLIPKTPDIKVVKEIRTVDRISYKDKIINRDTVIERKIYVSTNGTVVTEEKETIKDRIVEKEVVKEKEVIKIEEKLVYHTAGAGILFNPLEPMREFGLGGSIIVFNNLSVSGIILQKDLFKETKALIFIQLLF